ncbi:MAG: 3-phosphoshikimate 1-carboxyvinyltransferase [Anaeromassilibacillus sp.]
MSKVIVHPSTLQGTVSVPCSKSAAHRAILCAALAQGESILSPIAVSNDIHVTAQAAQALGANILEEQRTWRVTGGNAPQSPTEIDCGESGSTLRFLIPICAALGMEATFTGHGRLPERPIGVYLDVLPAHGVSCHTEGGLPLSINGTLKQGEFILPGNISSQFITGLLLACPLWRGKHDPPLLPAGKRCLCGHDPGGDAGLRRNRRTIGQRLAYSGRAALPGAPFSVEGDWSQAAFFLAAGALGGTLSIGGLKRESTQGDRAAESLFAAFGAECAWKGETLCIKSNNLYGMEIDAAQIPDLVPILAATAALAKGRTRIYNAARLRIKESDRLAAMADGLNRLGAQVQETPDGLLIDGVELLHGGEVDGYNDHRVVMALSIAALRADGPVTISDAESIRKSYPAFFEDYNRLGGKADVINMG